MNRFRVVRIGGEGASGTVSLAVDERTGRHVAVKELFADPRLRDRLRREVALLEGLRHPGIVSHFGVWFEPDVVFAVMPWIEGASLREVLDAGGALSVPEVLWIGAAIARALMEAHRRGIVHRDVKPANILIDLSGEPRVCDFGIAKAEGAADLTRTGGAVGSPGYMSPEQVQGDYCPASDQYSLGVVCWELVVGDRPFRGSSFEVQLAHLADPIPPLPTTDLPGTAALAAIVQRMLAKNPEHRWSSLDEVADALAAIGADPVAARSTLAARVARARRRRHFERLTKPTEVRTVHPNGRSQGVADDATVLEEGKLAAGPSAQPVIAVTVRTPPSLREPAHGRRQAGTWLAASVLVGLGVVVWTGSRDLIMPRRQLPADTSTVSTSNTSAPAVSGATMAGVPSLAGGVPSRGAARPEPLPSSILRTSADVPNNRPESTPEERDRADAPDTAGKADAMAVTVSTSGSEARLESPRAETSAPPASRTESTPDFNGGLAARLPDARDVETPAAATASPMIPVRRVAEAALSLPLGDLQRAVAGPQSGAFLAALRNVGGARPLRVEELADGGVFAVYELRNAIGRRVEWRAFLTASGTIEAPRLEVQRWERATP